MQITTTALGFAAVAGTTPVVRHLLELHAPAVRHPARDIAGLKARLALRHPLLWAAQTVPPGGALRRARQRRVDDLLDLFEAQHEFRQFLLLQIIAQSVVIVHRWPRGAGYPS